MVIWRTVWGPNVPTLKGTKALSLSCVQCILYLVSSSINVSIFHIKWPDISWTDLVWKNCLISLVLKEMQIRTTMRSLTPFRMATIKIKQNMSVGRDVEKLKPLYITDRNVKQLSRCRKQYLFLKKIKIQFTIWSSKSSSRYRLKRVASRYSNRYLYTHVHSIIIHNCQKAEKYPSVHQQTKEKWYIDSMEWNGRRF